MSRSECIFRTIDNVVQGRVGSKTFFRKGAAESKGTNELQRPAYSAAFTYIPLGRQGPVRQFEELLCPHEPLNNVRMLSHMETSCEVTAQSAYIYIYIYIYIISSFH